MTRMTGPDCAVMCNLINTHTHTHIPSHQVEDQSTGEGDERQGQGKEGGWGEEAQEVPEER